MFLFYMFSDMVLLIPCIITLSTLPESLASNIHTFIHLAGRALHAWLGGIQAAILNNHSKYLLLLWKHLWVAIRMLPFHVHSHCTSSRTNSFTMETGDLNKMVWHVLSFNVVLHVGHMLSLETTINANVNPGFSVAFCVDYLIQLLEDFCLT